MNLSSSLIPPTRTTYLDRRKTLSVPSLETPLKKPRLDNKTICHGITKDHGLVITTAALAHRLVNVMTKLQHEGNESSKEQQNDHLTELTRQICLCKRSLRFSDNEFVDIWLDQLLLLSTKTTTTTSSASPLLVYHALTRDTCLTLGTLVLRTELHWLTDQCQQLLLMVPPRLSVYRDYIEEMIVESRWDAIHALIDEEMESMCLVWSSANDNKRVHAKRCHHMEQLLVVMHDPQRLRMFSHDERRSMVKSHILNRLLAPDQDMDGMKAKQLLVEDERTLTIHGPILQHLTGWINPSMLLSPETSLSTFNLRLMLGLHMSLCQGVSEAYDIGKATDLLQELNDAAIVVITNGFRDKERMTIIMTMVQFLLLYTGEMLGLRYPKWFQQMFIDPESTHLHTTRVGQQFLEFLESLVSSDIPAVLQMHGKLLQGNRHLPVQKFVSAVKTRLMELGDICYDDKLDQSLRMHPTSICHPVQITQQQDRFYHHSAGYSSSASNNFGVGGSHGSSGHSAINQNTGASSSGSTNPRTGMATQENTVETILTSFQKSGLIPKSLLEDAIFRPLWFKKTFLPALLRWQSSSNNSSSSSNNNNLDLARDGLMAALKERKKISDQVYNDYLKQQQNNSRRT